MADDRAFYFDRLYPLQDEVLSVLRGLETGFYLTGAQSKAAGLFAPDVARVLMKADADDWDLVRWIDEPDRERYLGELHALGELLLLVDQE